MNSQVPFIVSTRKTERIFFHTKKKFKQKQNEAEETQDKNVSQMMIKKNFIKKVGNLFFFENLKGITALVDKF